MMRRSTSPLLVLTVAIVLADSAVVTLALPDILRELGGSVAEVAWVLIVFNLVLAIAAPAAAWICLRRDPALVSAVGMVIFAAASAACALAPSMGVLIASRTAQALGGALALMGCLELLVASTDDERGLVRWTAAGVVGAAMGPVAGGVLTEFISWQSIFIVQVPLTLIAVPAALGLRGRDEAAGERHRPTLGANVALAFVAAALTAALFLLVLLLVEGWRRSPLTAAVTVSVVPVAALAAPWIARLSRADRRSATVAGCILVSGGLAALALLPSAHLGWTVAPQILVGLGLGWTIDSLTADAMRGRSPRVLHGGWTIGARHAGVVLGLVVLTPVFTADLREAETPAQEAITGLVLDAPLRVETKVDLADGLSRQLVAERGRVPDLHPAFAALEPVDAGERRAVRLLEAQLDDQLERAAARAFRDSFLIASGLALVALGVVVGTRSGTRERA